MSTNIEKIKKMGEIRDDSKFSRDQYTRKKARLGVERYRGMKKLHFNGDVPFLKLCILDTEMGVIRLTAAKDPSYMERDNHRTQDELPKRNVKTCKYCGIDK